MKRGISNESNPGGLSMIRSINDLNASINASRIRDSRIGLNNNAMKSYSIYANNARKLRMKNSDLFLSMNLLQEVEEETKLINEKTKELLKD